MGVHVRPLANAVTEVAADGSVLRGSLRDEARAARELRRDTRLSPHLTLPAAGWLLGQVGGRPWCLSRTKRVMDMAVAIGMLLAAAPFMLLIALAIKLTSRGPVFFRQPRTGLRGRRFEMFKFRTMVEDAEAQKDALRAFNRHGADAVDFKIEDDPRVTPVGRVLRRFSLDELPNLFNIVAGDMSIVGPRPTSFDVDEYDDAHLIRLAVRPGLTGLWQVSGRSEVDFDERVQMDARYIREQSPWLDLKIILVTPLRVLDGWGAC